MLGRKRSLRSRLRPDAESKSPSSPRPHPTQLNIEPTIIPRPEPLRNAPSASLPQHPQSAVPNHTTYAHHPCVDPPPPEEMIGLALGSPGQSPLPPLFPDEGTLRSSKSPEPTYAPSHSTGRDAFRSKGSRWKGFGGIFGKRSGSGQPPCASSLYRIHEPLFSADSHTDHHQRQKHQASAAQPKTQHSLGRSTPNGLSRDWIGPEQLRSPQDRKDQGFQRKSSLRRYNVLRKQAKDVQKADAMGRTQLKGHSAGNSTPSNDVTRNTNVPRAESQGGSLLQVEIPSIELERYSVMFSTLLHPSQQASSNRQPSPNRQPSLLARRLGNPQELQTAPPSNVERPWMREEHASGNRPASPNKSPSFSLFPPSPTGRRGRTSSSTRERSPLQGSATTPGSTSPSKAKFDFSSPGEPQDQVMVIVHTPTEQLKPRRQATSEDAFSHIPSQMTTSSEDTFTTARASPVPSAKSSQKSVDGRNPSPQRPPEYQKPAAGPFFQKEAEISIARQISISKRQRQLLVPAVPKVAPQPVQPRIVDVQPGSRSRKSHHSYHLVLEDA
ncbi:MAG: hypothetical protein LQ338_006614 [Usnochroma carphineum]|nr:MAG: hypothetical protein LQ338_006614 [Usnochroma carphineum]